MLGGIVVLLNCFFSKPFKFISNDLTVQIANSLLVITLWGYLVLGHSFILSSTMRASGAVLWQTLIRLFVIWYIEVPVAYLLSHYTSLGMKGIWFRYPATFLVGLGLNFLYYKFYWRKKRIVSLVN
ncbi:hypothetical protein MY490_02070 [Gottfriedia acidiceleris]|uniref:Uncharacterized protein n=1 Tax=Gottfriedia acidiceleris TaxID=371036 RepID=A0ABY4JMM9_9BACI|nr:hypothetical protein [Gottfriedia acidiceleris]UPM54681.1 hypothetical protein MY490_02070 [Gottfriedia acidiceleris]